tara:strand:- start:384 stop:686 length:303 start_codon:yes stop_codon:yes gene_type:complete
MTQRFYESTVGDLIGDRRIANTIIGDDRKEGARKLKDGRVHTSHLVYAVEKALKEDPHDPLLNDGKDALEKIFPEFYGNQTEKPRSYKAVNEGEGFRVRV